MTFVRNALLVSVPAVASAAIGVYFLCQESPKIISARKAAVTREYREFAERLADGSLTAQWRRPREKGWRQVSKLDHRYPWGYVVKEGGLDVWLQREGETCGVTVPEIVDDTALWLYGGTISALALMLAMTALGIYLLYRYGKDREEFLHATVHDFRSPLVGLRSAIRRRPEAAERLVEHLLRMVRNAQDFFAVRGRRGAPRREEFDLAAAVRDSYALFEKDFAEDESGPVAFEMPERFPITADETMTRQILWNLFGNAVKYAAPYGPVAVRLASRGGLAVLEFADQGLGMTPRQMRLAFRRYYRAHTIEQCGRGGSGIGLATSLESARRMGGDLTVAPNRPKGCIFTLSLPLHP